MSDEENKNFNPDPAGPGSWTFTVPYGVESQNPEQIQVTVKSVGHLFARARNFTPHPAYTKPNPED